MTKMISPKKILSPIDFSEPSYHALAVADRMAGHFSAELMVMHVVSASPIFNAAPTGSAGFHTASVLREMKERAKKSAIEVIKEKVSKKTKTRTVIVQGYPSQDIVRMAEAEDVDIIVIATNGSNGWKRFVFGSVAERVVRLAPCPVLIIPPPRF